MTKYPNTQRMTNAQIRNDQGSRMVRRARAIAYWSLGFWALFGYLGAWSLGISAGGEYNRVLNVGDPAPPWTELPGVDGKKHSLADLTDKDVVVVVFTCCSCPVAVDYEDKIIAFAKKYTGPKDKVALVAINVNTIEEDRLPAMQERAREKGFTFAYLYDESQKIAHQFGASYTPEFFVLNKERKVIYMGAMDHYDPKVKTNYLEEAVQAALRVEKAPTGETLARGCRIRWARKRS